MGCNCFVSKLKKFECFLNKIDLPWCCVVFFVVCLLLGSIFFNAISASYRYLGVPLLKEYPGCQMLVSRSHLSHITRLLFSYIFELLLSLFRCSTAKRKTRPNTDFRGARRSKRINPPKINLLLQFLHRSKADMLKFSVSSPATQFHSKRVPYEAFVSPQLRFGKFEIGALRLPWTHSPFAW